MLNPSHYFTLQQPFAHTIPIIIPIIIFVPIISIIILFLLFSTIPIIIFFIPDSTLKWNHLPEDVVRTPTYL